MAASGNESFNSIDMSEMDSVSRSANSTGSPALASMKNAFSVFESQMNTLQTELTHKSASLRQQKAKLDETLERLHITEEEAKRLQEQLNASQLMLKDTKQEQAHSQMLLDRANAKASELQEQNHRLNKLLLELNSEKEKSVKEHNQQLQELSSILTVREKKQQELSEQLRELQAQNNQAHNNFEKELKAKEEIINELQTEKNNLAQSNVRLLNNMNQLNEQLVDAHTSLKKANNMTMHQEETLIQLTTKCKELSSSNELLAHQLEQANEKCKQMREKVDDYFSDNVRLEKELADSRTKYDQLRADYEKQLDEMRMRHVSEHSTFSAQSKKQIEALKKDYEERIEFLETELRCSSELSRTKELSLVAQMQTNGEERKQMESRLIELTEMIADKEKALKQNRLMMHTLQEQNDLNKKKLEEDAKQHIDEINNLNQIITHLNNEKDILKDELQKQENQQNQLHNKIQQLDQQLYQARNETQDIFSKLEQANKERINANASLLSVKTEVATVQAQLRQAQEISSEKDKQIEQLELQIAQQVMSERLRNKDRENLVEQKSDLLSKVQQFEKNCEHLNDELEKANRKSVSLESEADALKSEIIFLSSNLRNKNDKELVYLKEIKEFKEILEQFTNEKLATGNLIKELEAEKSNLKKVNEQFLLCEQELKLKNEELTKRIYSLEESRDKQIESAKDISQNEQRVRDQLNTLQDEFDFLQNEKHEVENWLVKYNIILRKYMLEDSTPKFVGNVGSKQIIDPEEIRKIFIQYTSKLNEIESLNTDLKHEIDLKERLIQNLKQKHDKLISQLDEISHELVEIQHEKQEVYDELENTKRKFEARDHKMIAERKYMTEKLLKLNSFAEDVQKEKLLLQEENASLKSLNESMEKKLSNATYSNKSKEQTANDLQLELHQSKIELRKATSESINLQQDIIELKEKLQISQTELINTQKALNTANNTLQQCSLHKKQLEITVEEMKHKLSFHENSSKDIICTVEKLEQQIKENTEEKEFLEKELQKKSELLSEMNEKNDQLQQKLQQFDADLTLYRNMLNKFCQSDNSNCSTPNCSNGSDQNTKDVSTKPRTKQLRFNEDTRQRKAESMAEHLNENLKNMKLNCKNVQSRIKSLQSFMEKESELNSHLISDTLGKLLPSSAKSSSKEKINQPQDMLDNITKLLSKNKSEFLNDTDRVFGEMKQLERENLVIVNKVEDLRETLEKGGSAKESQDEERTRRLQEARNYAESLMKQQANARKKHAVVTENKIHSMRSELLQSFDPSQTPAMFKRPAGDSNANQITSTPMQKSERVKKRLDHKFV